MFRAIEGLIPNDYLANIPPRVDAIQAGEDGCYSADQMVDKIRAIRAQHEEKRRAREELMAVVAEQALRKHARRRRFFENLAAAAIYCTSAAIATGIIFYLWLMLQK